MSEPRSSPPSPQLARVRRISWIALALSISFCAALAGLHHEERRTIQETVDILDHVRTARVDLAMGLLQAALGSRPDSPFDRDAGFARLDHSMMDFEHAAAAIEGAEPSASAFRDEVRVAREHLAAWRAEQTQAAEGRLRVAVLALEQRAEAIDDLTNRRLARLADRYDALFVAVSVIAALAFAGIWAALTVAGRATRAAEMERARAEEELRALNAELEARVSVRTGELAALNDTLGLTNAGLEAEIEERTQLEARLSRGEARARALADLSASLAEQGLDVAPLAAKIVERTCELVGDSCFVLLLSEDGAWQEIVASGHRASEIAAPPLDHAATFQRAPAGVLGEVARSGQPLLEPEVTASFLTARAERSHATFLREGLSSLLCVPMRARDRVVGAIGVGRYGAPHPYDEEDKAFLQDLADRAGLAIDNARLFVQIREARALAERANVAKSEFLASMSHELRTPLNGVLGLTEAMQEEVYGELNARQRVALSRVHESGRHLLSLINDVLDLAKVEAGKLTLDPCPADPVELVQSSLRMVQDAARKKALEVSLDLAPGIGVVEMDERRLKQVLVNLLSNAVKFTPNGGAIGVEVGLDEHGDALTFVVWDHGIGIGADDLGRLFQPFVQLDAGLSRRHAGTGLGLALVRRIVDLHGGSVAVHSEPSVGSRFRVAIPLRRARRGAPDPAPPPPAAGAARVLLIDDEPLGAAALREALLTRGHEVQVARDGDEALAIARRDEPDLIVVDLQAPGVDLRAVRASSRAARIVALTALALPGDRDRALAAGADEHLARPVGVDRLTRGARPPAASSAPPPP